MDKFIDIQITEYQPNDLTQVINLLDICDDHSQKVFFKEGHKRTFAWCAQNGERIIGLLMGWKKTFHPYAHYISLHIHPHYRTQQLEDILIKTLQKVPNSQPFQISSWENQYPTVAFYTRNHFKKIRHTYTVLLRLDKIINNQLISNRAVLSDENYLVYSLEQWQKIDIKLYDLAIYVRDDYAEKHVVNPLGVHEIEKWQDLLNADDILQNGSYVLYDSANKEIVAYGLMHSCTTGVVELGWSGSKSYALQEWEVLLWKQFYFAHDQGYHSIEMEIDNTDQERFKLLERYPFEIISIYNTYQLDKR